MAAIMQGMAAQEPAAQAAAAFLGGEAAAVRPLGAGTANRSFLVEDRAGDAFVLRRRSPKYAGAVFAAFEAEYLEHLGKAGLPVPRLLPAPGGTPFLPLDGTLWQMSPRIPGAPYAGTAAQIAGAGRALALLHNALLSFVPIHERDCPRWENQDLLRSWYAQFLADLPPAAREDPGHAWVPRLMERLEEALPNAAYAALPKLHIHGDYHSFNLLFDGGEVCGIFDFDKTSRQARLRDVADGLIFFGSRRAGPIDDRDIVSLTQSFVPDEALCGLFLQSYAKAAALPLSGEEQRLLPCFLAARFLGMRLDGLSKLPPERRASMLTCDTRPTLHWLAERGLDAFT